MTTLRDMGAEFHDAAGKLDELRASINHARIKRLAFVRDVLHREEQEVESAKRRAHELPAAIAAHLAEIAHLEAMTVDDLLAEALRKPELPPAKHACPRCDEGMREVVITEEPRWFGRETIAAGTRLRAFAVYADGFIAVDDRANLTTLFRFVRDDIPPRSEWCDGSGVKS